MHHRTMTPAGRTSSSRRGAGGANLARALVAASALLLLAGCGSGSGSGSASPTPNLSNYEGPGLNGTEYVDVEPHNNLTDGQTVMVSGLHFKPNLEIAFNMCKLIVRGYSDCDPTTTQQNKAKTDAAGTFPPTPYKVTEHVAFPSSRNTPVDCGTSTCSVGVGDVGGVTAGSHCVGFGGSCQPEPGNKPLGLLPVMPLTPLLGALPLAVLPRWWLRR